MDHGLGRRATAVTPAGERSLAEVRGNYQRLRRHAFEPLELNALRLVVHATNGSPQARVFELRCYG